MNDIEKDKADNFKLLPYVRLNWVLTLILPLVSAATTLGVSYGAWGMRLGYLEKQVEEQRLYHHISREEVTDMVANHPPSQLQVESLRSDLESTKIRMERIDTKLDNILEELRKTRGGTK